MLGKLFGFRGRMGRLSYFGWAILASVFWLVWLFAIAGGLMAAITKGSWGALLGSGLIAIVGVIPLVWMFLALVTKRLRDAGFPPIVVVPVMVAFSLFDIFVLSRQSGTPIALPYIHNSPLGVCVNLVYGLVLLFWPSAAAKAGGDGGETRRPGEAPWHERAFSAVSSTPPQQDASSNPLQVPSYGQPRHFGRRRMA